MLINIGCGTYKGEVFYLGFNCESLKFTENFIDSEAHISNVTSIVVNKTHIISGSIDGNMQCHSIESKRRIFTFDVEHEKEITSLCFSNDGKFLLSSSNDCNIVIWSKRNNTWNKVQTLTKHKKGVTSFALHPTDKLALSIGKDDTLRVWNLCHAKQAHKIQTNKLFNNVAISTNGTYYTMSTFICVQVYDFADASLKSTINLKKSMKDIKFISDDVLCVAEMSKLVFYRISNECVVICDLAITDDYKCRQLSVARSDSQLLLVCNLYKDTDSAIRVYDVTNVDSGSPMLLATYDVLGTRISSIDAVFM